MASRVSLLCAALLVLGAAGDAVPFTDLKPETATPAFPQIDADSDGKLSQAECTEVNLAFAEWEWKMLDRDSDGKLGLEEWRTFLVNEPPEFASLDADGDAMVTQAELELARYSLPEGWFEETDKTGDGKLSEVEWTTAFPPAKSSSWTAPTFHRYDADLDGMLTKEECKKGGVQLPPVMWRKLDQDKDGKISVIEWTQAGRPQRRKGSGVVNSAAEPAGKKEPAGVKQPAKVKEVAAEPKDDFEDGFDL